MFVFLPKIFAMPQFYPLTVQEIKRETPLSVSITFLAPSEHTKAFAFEAGQYITIKHTLGEKELRRSYSLCTTPKSNVLKVAVKQVENGLFSVFANTKLTVGDVLQVSPPEGKFVFSKNNNTKNNYLAIAAGSGITPVLSIVKTALEEDATCTFLLIYGNKTAADTIFLNELKELQNSYSGRFYLELLYSRKEEEGARFGRIDRSIVNYFLKNKYTETTFDISYLCGPEEMIHEVSETLEAFGLNKDAIHYELFTSSDEGELTDAHEGFTALTITVDDETFNLQMSQKKSILDIAIENKIDAPYSCQGGICSTCIARVIEGKVEMRKNQILTESELEEGLILTCQAHPTTPTLVVDYDDV